MAEIFISYLKKADTSYQAFLKMKPHQQSVYFITYGASMIKLRPRNAFFRRFMIWNSVRKALLAALVVLGYKSPAACLAYVAVQQSLWVGLFIKNKIEKRMAPNLLAIFGELQLLAVSFLIGWIYYIDVADIQRQSKLLIDQGSVNKKITIGWLVIAVFVIQNLIVLQNLVRSVIPSIIANIKIVFRLYLAQIYYHTIYI